MRLDTESQTLQFCGVQLITRLFTRGKWLLLQIKIRDKKGYKPLDTIICMVFEHSIPKCKPEFQVNFTDDLFYI